MILQEVHNRDLVDLLEQKKASGIYDFEWTGQMRYYWEDNECVVRMVNATLMYGYEYLGSTNRLVVTPLTEKCHRTLTR